MDRDGGKEDICVYMRNSRGAHLFISNSIRIFARIKLDPLFFFFFKNIL